MEAHKERKEREEQLRPVQLPIESSRYVKYEDLEDYKMKGYGTWGHQQPVDLPQRGGGTDAPTLSGSGLTERQARSVDADPDPVRRPGVPWLVFYMISYTFLNTIGCFVCSGPVS